jgi:hypothetical protein
MDIRATIIFLIIAGVIALPFIFYSLIQKFKRDRFIKQFTQLTRSEGFEISMKELWGKDYAIAIDGQSKRLIYTRRSGKNLIYKTIDLIKMEKCRIMKTDIMVEGINGQRPESNKLDLILIPKISSDPEVILEFYNNASFMPSQEHHGQIEKWMQIVRDHI